MTDATQETVAESQTEVQEKGPTQLVLGLVVLALAMIVSLLAIIMLVPDENNYAKATLLKHERLETLEGRKVVMVGGSNLAYGLESDVIEQATGCPTVNMGMNGYFGARYMLNEVRPSLHEGDIVVIAFEWDNYGKTVDGVGKDLFAVTKANPGAVAYLTPLQVAMATSNIPYVAQAKLFRVLDETARGLVSSGEDGDAAIDVLNRIEVLEGFDEQGDLNSHDGIVWEMQYEQGSDLETLGLETGIIELIKSFSADMEERGVTVLVSYTPTMRSYFDEQSAVISEAHRQLTTGTDAVNAPRAPEAFAFGTEYFFDTVYHLKTTTRAERSQMVADDIHKVLGSTPDCRAN